MLSFARLFLIFSLADAAFALAEALLPAPLLPLRQAVSAVVLLLAGILYLGLGIDRRLPRRVLLPPIVFAFWAALVLWPLPPLLGGSHWPLWGAAGELLLGSAALAALRRPPSRSVRRFSLRGTLLFFAGSALLLPPLLLVAGLASVDRLLDGETGGFMRVHPDGIYMTERLYRRAAKSVRLVGMVHVGEEGYYRSLAESVGGGRTVVLVEGVGDRDGLLRHRFDYGGFGGVLGLVSQERLQFEGRVVEAGALAAPGEGDAEGLPDIVRADVDLADFEPQTVAFLNAVGELLASGEAADILRDYSVWVGEEMTPELQQTLLDDILHRRNAELLRHLDRGLQGYDTVVIPWGAMHMPAVEAALRQRGFALAGQSERRSVDFARLPYARLLARVAGD